MRIRHLSSVLAASLLTPALVVLPVTPFSASAGSTPAASSERRVPLVDPSSSAVDSGTVASDSEVALAKSQVAQAGVSARLSAKAFGSAGPQVLKVSPEQTLTSPVNVVGVTWQGKLGRDTVVQYRTRGAGAWEAWQPIDSDSAADDANAPAASERGGSDPIPLAGAKAVQLRVLGAPGTTVTDPELSIIDPGVATADSTVGTSQPGAANAAAARPTILSRAAWGANESWRKDAPSYAKVKGVIIHHTAGTNGYTPDQVPAVLRGIYAFHTKDRGWNDIAYNFLVDRWGRVWEGRAGGVTRAVLGAHALGYNTETMGISVMGDFQNAAIPQAAVTAVEKVIAWKAGIHGFSPNAMTTLYGRREPTIQGHRDVNQTTCPGNYFYAKIPEIRRAAASLARGGAASSGGAQTGSTTPAPPAPPAAAKTAITDVLMRGSSNALFRTSPVGTTDMGYAQKLSAANWGAMNAVVSAGDLNRDGRSDVIARNGAGSLYFYPGTATGLGTAKLVGSGWSVMTSITGAGDMTGDGIPDVVATTAAGDVWLYRSYGNGGFAKAVKLASGWAGSRVVGLGDWDGDKKADLLRVAPNGAGTLYRGTGRSGLASSLPLFGNYGYATLVGLPGQRALFAVDAAGTGWMIRRYGASTVRVAKAAPNFRGLTVYAG